MKVYRNRAGSPGQRSRNPLVIGLLLLLAAVDLGTSPARAGDDPSDPAWGCYDPEPGHPTSAEIIAFFTKVSEHAKTAEKQQGVPAAAIAAMSMLESGYGFTRTAQFANNLFGWKAPDSDTTAYVLTCQPPSDPGNHYRRFADWASALDAVASRLGLQGKANYAAVSKKYMAARAASVPVAEAVANWVKGIQRAGYNPNPSYPDRVLAIANNYRSPGRTVSPEFNLYLLSEVAQPANAETAAPGGSSQATQPDQQTNALQHDIAVKIAKRFAGGGRYVVGADTPAHPHEYCKAIAPGDPMLANPLVAAYAGLAGSENAKILECTYPFKGPDPRHGWVLVVAATADNIATRIVTACTEAAPEKAAACAEGMLGGASGMPWGSNNFIFPITGFVNEPCKGPLDRLIGFRHGVTVQYGTSMTDTKPIQYCSSGIGDQGSDWQKQVALTNSTAEVFNVGRIAAVSRNEIPGMSFPKEKPKPGLDPDSFQTFVRDNEIRAVESGNDRLMVIKAAHVMNVAIPPTH